MNRFKLALLFLLIAFRLNAQELHFSPYQPLQNLPSLETYSTFQDSKGVIWICTDAGLHRYDGNTLTTYTTEDGISENVVLRAYEDKKGRVWFCTLSGYFFYYENGIFHTIAANKFLKGYVRAVAPQSFFIGENDTLYFCPISVTGVIKIPPQNNYAKIIHIPTNNWKLNRLIILNKLNPGESIMGSTGGTIKSGATDFGFRWNGKDFTLPFSRKNNGASNAWRGISNRDGSIVYVCTGTDLSVIKENGRVVEYYDLPERIQSLYIDEEDDLWITYVGLKGGALFKHSDLRSTPIRFLNSSSVSTVRVDREGTVWAATLEKGIFVCFNKNVLKISNDAGSKVHVFRSGVNHLDVYYSKRNRTSFFANDSLYKDSLSYIQNTDPLFCFVSTPGYQYYMLGDKLYFKMQHSPQVYLRTIGVKELLVLENDTVLAMSTRDILRVHNGKITEVISPGFTMNFITRIRNGDILIGSRDNSGLFKYKNKKVVHYFPDEPALKTRINTIAEDTEGRLWIATNEHGLFCYDTQRRLHEFNKKNGFIASKVNSLTLDNKNTIWCATNNGLIKLQLHTGLKNVTITNFTKMHGLPDTRIDKITSFRDKIFCFTKDNLFYFKGDALQKNTTPPLVQIMNVSINGNQIPFSDTLIMEYNHNNFQLTPLHSSFKNVEKRNFVYKLDGYTDEWHLINKNDIKYTNLDHGTYVLTVYGLNSDNYKSETPVTFTLIIKKPFWLSWWFIVLALSVLGLLFNFFLNLWRRRIEKKEHDKALVNQRISEFKMTALRSQMNPHFIFNAIGSIQHYILNNDKKNSNYYLSKFALLIRNILNNSRQEYISLSQEIATLRLYIELEQIRCKYPFEFILDMDEEVDEDMDIPTMLIQPYIENSIWHGLMPKESAGVLELIFRKEENHVLVIIRDNGVGRRPKDAVKTHISRGMSITEQRIQVLESTTTKKFETKVIDLKNDKGEPEGTQVNLIIPIGL